MGTGDIVGGSNPAMDRHQSREGGAVYALTYLQLYDWGSQHKRSYPACPPNRRGV